MTKIVSATLYCDRRPELKGMAIKPLLESGLIDSVYINIQTDKPDQWKPMMNWAGEYKKKSGDKKMASDMWAVTSSWRTPPQYDQDQKRVRDIVCARNMAIDYAIAQAADYLLFVDSDVIIDADDVETLLNMNANLCGGLVNGRGTHRDNHYIFGEVSRNGDIIHCTHGTCGYMLIHKSVFEIQNFRYGWDEEYKNFLSEDPAYCQDWFTRTGELYQINTTARAMHWDDPYKPLKEEDTAKDAWDTLRK